MDGFQELLKAGGGKVRTAKADDETVTRLLDTVQNSLRTQESGGAKNPLKARNPRTSALGAFQIMPSNIPAWTSKYLGKSMSEEEFASNEDAQIKVFRGQFGSYLRETLNESDDEDTAIRKASAMWYGGPRGKKQYDNPVRFRPDEPSYREYTTSILNRIKKGQVSKPDQTGDDEFQKLLKAGEGPDEFEQLLEYGANLQTKSEIPTTGKVESEIPNKPVESKTAQRTETTSEPKIYDDLESFSTKINLQIKRPLKFTEEALESRRSGVPLATNVPETREQTNREIVIDAISSEISSRLSNEYRKVDPEDVVFVINKYGMKGDDPNDASTFYNFKVDMNDPSDRDFIETVLEVNEQKTQAAQQLLASGMPISSNLMKQYEEAIGLSYEFIEKAKTDPKFEQAVTQGAAVKKIYDGYVKELLKGLKPGESPELAFNGAAAYVGWINDEQLVQANNKAREGFEALKNEVSSSVFDAERMFLEYVQKPLAVTSPLYMGTTSEDVTQWTPSQIDEMTKSLIKRYGSAENYYRVQEELRNKYKAGSGNAYAGPFEFVKRFGVGALKVLPQAVKVGAIIGDASKGGIVLSTEANPVWKLGDKIEKYLDDLKNNDFDDVEAISLVADTTGQLFTQIVAGIVSGGATLPTIIGAISGFSGASDEAIKAGADPATTAAAGIVGALAAAPDGLILGKWFKGLKGPEQLSFLEKLSASLLKRFGIEYGPEAAQAMTKKTMGDMLKLGGKNLLFGTTAEGPQEVLENKTNDLAAFILYDRTPERWDKLTKITKDDAQSFIGGVIGGGFGGSFETAVEALNNKQATQILSYLPGLFKDGNIGEAEYNQAKAALERLLAQDKKLEEEIDIKSYPVDVPRMQELGYSEDDLSKLTPADVKVIDDNNVQREVFYELNQRQKEELTGEKYVAPEEPIAGEIGQTEIKVKPKVEDSPEVKSFEEFDAELDNGFSLHTRKYETGSTFEITNQSETSKGITSWGKNNPGAIYEAESFEAFEKSILHLQANDDYQILIGDNIPEEYIRKAEDKGLLKESKTKIKEVEKTAANLATNSPFTNARYWNLPKNKERKYGTSYRLPADTPPSDLPKGKTIVRLKSGEFQVFDSTTKKPVKKEKPEKRDKFAATEIGLDREKTTTAPTPKKVVIKDAIDLVNKATFGPVGERNKHDTVLNAAFKNQMKFGGEAGNFTTTENGEYRVFNFNNEYYAVPSQGFEVDRTSLKSGTVNEVFNIVGGENYKVIAPAIVEKKGSKVSVSKKGVLQVPGKFIEGYVEPEAKKEAPKKEVPKLETKEPIKPKETKKAVPSLTTKKVFTKKVGDTVKIKGPANKNKVFTVDRVLGKGEDAKYRLKDESGKSVSKTFTSKDFRDEAATVKPSDESPEVRHSVADIAKLEVPEAQNFANIFQRHIKAKDRNYEDLRRIGNELLDSAIRNPEKWVPSASDIKIEDLLRMPDGTQFDPDNFEHHLNAPDQVIQLYNLTQTNPEAARRALEDEKHAITKSRLEDIANLAGYLKDNDLYAPETSALIVYGASKWGFQISEDGKVSLINISKNNRTMVAVVDAKMAPSIAQELQKGLPLKTAFLNGIEKGVEQAKKSNSKNRGSEWVKFTQSNKESDAARLNEACAGSSWCTFFGGVETARTQLSGGDFYVYYENGKPEIAIRMRGKEIAEVRGNTSRQTLDSKHLPILEEKFKDPELKSGADKLKKNRHRIEVVKRLATEADPDIIFNEIIADEENDNVPVFDSDHLINDYLRSDHGMNLSISKVVVKRAQDNVNKLLKNKKLLIEKGFLLNDDYDFSGYTDEELDRIKYIANATISNLNGSLNNVKKILGTNKFVDSVVRMPVLSHINDLEVVRSTIETESLKKVNSLKFGEYSSITYNRGFKVDAIIFTGHKYASPILNGPHLSVDMGLVGPRFDLADPTFLQASFNKLQISTDSNLVNLSEVTTRILAITHRSHSTESGVQVVKINRTATEPLKELQLVSQNREIVFEGPSGIDDLYGYNSQYYPASIIEKYKFKNIDYTGSLSEDRDMKITMHPESKSLFIQEWAPEADEYDNRPALTIKGAEKLKYADVSLYAPVVFQDLKEVDESLKISTPHSIKLDKLKIADSLDLYTNTSVELPSFTTAGTDIRKEGVLDPYLESGQGDLHFASYGDRAVTVSLPKLEKAYSINIEYVDLKLANEDLKIDGLYADGSMTADVTATIHTKHSFKLWNSTNFHLIAPNITNIRLMKSYGGTIIEAPNLLTLDNVDNSIVTVLSPTYPESLENEAARLLQEKSEDAKFNFIGEFGFLNAEGQEEIDAQSEVIEKLTANGLSPFEVYAHTGWYYDVKDKKYKSYIDPRQAQMTAKLIDYLEGKLDVGDNAKAAKALEDHGIPLGSALDYPELYKYYPHFEAMRLIHKPSISSKAYMKLGGRVYDSDNNFLGYAPSEIVIGEFDNLADAMSSIIHEIQHAIQFYEGFAQGANHQEMVNILRFYQKQTVSRNMTESETLRIAEDVVARLKTHPPGIIENVFNQESLFSTYLARRPGYAAVTSDFQDAIYGLIKRALLRTGKPDTDSLINDYKSLSNSSKRELNGELIKAAESFTQSVRVRVEMARKNNNEGFENELKKIGLSMKDLSEEPNLNKLAMLAYKRSYGEIESRMSERNLASKSDRIVFPAHNKDYYNHAWVEQSDAKLSEFEKVVDLRDITDNPYIEISGKELRTKSLFSASPADIRLNKLSTLEELDVKYVLGINSRELGGNLYVSPEGMDYLRRLIASVKNQTPKVVNGVAVNESLKASLLKAIKDGKKEFKAAGYTEKDLQGITKIAKFLSTHPESLSLIYTNGAIIPHEMAHIARAEKSRIKEFGDYYEDFAKTFGKTEKLAEKSYEHFYKSAYFSNKDFGKLTKKEKLELQEEMVASIIQGDFERIGLTDNEAAKFLYNDLKDYVDNNGGEILTALEEWQHERIRNYGILEAIRENRPIVSKRKPAGRGSEPSPNVEVSNKTEQQSENKTETKGLLKTLESQGVVNLEDYTDESKSYVPKTLGSEAAAAQKWLNELGISRAYQEALGLKTPSALNTAKRMIVIEYLDDRIEFYTLSGNEGRARAWYDKLVMFTSSISSDFTEYGQAIAQLARWSKKSPDQLIATVNASLSNKKTPSKLTTEEENEIRRSAEEIANLDFEIRYIERLLERDDAVIIDELRQMFEDKYNGIVTMLKMILPSNQQEVEVMFDDKTEVLSSAVDKVESDIHLLEAPVRDALINLGLLVHLRGAHPYKYQDWQSAFKQEVANMGLSIDPVESYLRSTYRTVLSKENEMKRRLQIERIMEKYEFTEEGQAYEKLAELRAQRIEANKILSANKKYAKGDLDQRTPLEISIDNNLGLSYLSREDILLSMNRNEFFSTYAKKGLSFKQIMNFYLDALEVIDAAQKDLKAEKRLIRAQKHLGALNIFGGFSEEDIQKLEADLIEKRKAKSTITHELNRYIAERNKSPESRRERVLDWYKRLNRSGEAILTATIKTAMHNIIAQRGTKAFNAIEMSIATLYNKLPFWSEDPNAYDDDVEFWRPLEEEIKSSTFPQLRATVREALEGDIEIMSLARTFLFYKEMVAQGYLSHNPDLYDKMIGQFTYGDVKEKVNTIKEEWSTSTKLMEKSVRAVEHYVNMATAVNRLQEKHFRFATFIANVNLQLKAKGIDPFNVNSEDIPRDILERSVKRALEDTFGEDYNLDNAVGRLLEASNDVLSWVPFFVNPLLFRRFFFNSLKFVYDHSAMLAVKTITRDKITARDMAKFTTGITMFLMALQILRQFGTDDDDPTILKYGDYYVRVSAYNPLSNFLVLANAYNRYSKGKSVLKDKKNLLDLIGIDSRYPNVGLEFLGDLVEIFGTSPTKWVAFENTLKVTAGKGLSAFARPLSSLKDIVTLFDADQGLIRDYSEVPFYGELMKNVPYSDTFGESMGLNVPVRQNVISGEDVRKESPIMDQLGITFVSASQVGAKMTPAEEYLDTEIKGNRFILSYKTPEEKRRSGVVAQFYQALDKGIDIKAQLLREMKNQTITEDQFKDLRAAMQSKSILDRKAKNASILQVVGAMDFASIEEKEVLKKILRQKIARQRKDLNSFEIERIKTVMPDFK